jgi:hypothetical protein
VRRIGMKMVRLGRRGERGGMRKVRDRGKLEKI